MAKEIQVDLALNLLPFRDLLKNLETLDMIITKCHIKVELTCSRFSTSKISHGVSQVAHPNLLHVECFRLECLIRSIASTFLMLLLIQGW